MNLADPGRAGEDRRRGDPRRMSANRPRVLAAVTWGYLTWSFLPVAYALRASLSATGDTPPTGFSLDPYRFALQGGETQAALLQSVKLGLITVAITVPIGTSLALAFRHLPGRVWRWLQAAVLMGIAMPPIVFAMILLYLFAFVFRIGLTTQAQVVGHGSLAIPFVTLVILIRLISLERHLEEQAQDLGAPPSEVVRRVLLPMLGPAIAVASAVAFTISFNDIVISRALCFPNECHTIPMLLYGGRSQDEPAPPAFALAVLSVAVTTAVLAVSVFALARRRARAGAVA
jgi:ABC-type spermidine/putrescine transport system permease subunit II